MARKMDEKEIEEYRDWLIRRLEAALGVRAILTQGGTDMRLYRHCFWCQDRTTGKCDGPINH